MNIKVSFFHTELWHEVLSPLLFVVSVIVAAVLGCIVLVIGLTWANSQWNCNAWHKTTGDKTAVVAGTCMVQNPRNGRWEEYGAYITHHNLSVETDD